MSTAKLTLVGMYQYDNTLFSSLVLPDGIDKETFIANLIMSKGEFELLYPDREFLKTAIMVWGNKWYHTFNKWITALNIEYDPLNNYDRYEEWEDNAVGNEESSKTESSNTRDDETNSITGNYSQNVDAEGRRNGTNQNINTVSAYNSSAWQNHDKSDGTESETNTESTETTGTNRGAEEKEAERNYTGNALGTVNNTKDAKHTGHMYGNIGVTTSQQMLESELDIAKWNLYNQMADVFSNELLIGVY